MVCHWSLSESKSPWVSRTLLSILAVLHNVVLRMVSTRPVISMSSSPFHNPSVTVPRTTITNCTIVSFMFYSFFKSLARSRYFSSFNFLSVLFKVQLRQESLRFRMFSFLLLIIIRSRRVAEIRWSVCMWKSPRGLCVSFSRTDVWLGIHHWFVLSYTNFFYATLSCLIPILRQFPAFAYYEINNFVSITYICYFVTSYLFSLWYDWFFMPLFCAVIWRDSVFLFRFPFLSHRHFFSCEMLLISRLKRPTSCFSSQFCFLVIVVLLVFVLSVLFLVAVISLSPHFSMLYSSRFIDASRCIQCW